MKTTQKISTLVVLTFVLLSLSGCLNLTGGDTTETPQNAEGSVRYENANFSLTIPAEWQIFEKNDFTGEVPSETELVVRNNVKNETFTANLNIIRKDLQQNSPSTEFANLIQNRQSTGLIAYREINKESLTLKIGGTDTQTYLVEFEARKDNNEPLIRYVQIYAVKNNNAYVVTGAYSPQESETVVNLVKTAVRSFAVL